MILAKIVEDPQSGTCLNVSYADITGPVANPNPTGSPFANSPGGAGGQGMQNGSLGAMNNPLSAGEYTGGLHHYASLSLLTVFYNNFSLCPC